MILDQVKDFNYLKMEIFMTDNIVMVSQMELEFINGKLDKFMMDNGKMDLNKVKEFGKIILEIHIWVNGKKASHKDLEFIFGTIKINIKVNF